MQNNCNIPSGTSGKYPSSIEASRFEGVMPSGAVVGKGLYPPLNQPVAKANCRHILAKDDSFVEELRAVLYASRKKAHDTKAC